MAARNKAELLAITAKEFEKLQKIVNGISGEEAELKGDDDTSIKDIVAHRAHWIELFLGWYEDGLAGKPVFFPAEGYKWSDLKRYNADLRQRQSDVGWSEATSMLQESYERLTAFIEGHSDEALYGGPMKGAKNDWTPGRWAEAAGASHFRSAAKYLRAQRRRAA